MTTQISINLQNWDASQGIGFTHHKYGNALAFWLPEHLELKDIITRF